MIRGEIALRWLCHCFPKESGAAGLYGSATLGVVHRSKSLQSAALKISNYFNCDLSNCCSCPETVYRIPCALFGDIFYLLPLRGSAPKSKCLIMWRLHNYHVTSWEPPCQLETRNQGNLYQPCDQSLICENPKVWTHLYLSRLKQSRILYLKTFNWIKLN